MENNDLNPKTMTEDAPERRDLTPDQMTKELIFSEADCWELSGVPMDEIKREFVEIDFGGNS